MAKKITKLWCQRSSYKHVLQAFPIHLVSAVTPSSSVLERIPILFADFFWGWKIIGKDIIGPQRKFFANLNSNPYPNP